MAIPSKYILHHYLYQKEVEDYRSYLLLLGYAKKTCQARYLYLKEFFYWLEAINIYDLQNITSTQINDFHRYIQTRKSEKTKKKLKLKTIYDRMRTIQMYLGYALQGNKITSNPASYLKFKHPKQECYRAVFTLNQILQLYQVTQNLQEKALLHMAYGCGLRAQEISDLKKVDIRLVEQIIIVQKGKNSKRRLVPINDKIKTELELFIFSIEKKQQHLFTNCKAKPMQPWTANKVLKDLIIRTDFGKTFTKEELNKIGIHTLRHSIATHLLESGMKLELIQLFLGHSHIESTEIYTHINQSQINSLYDDNN